MKNLYLQKFVVMMLLMLGVLTYTRAQNYQWAKGIGGQYQDIGVSMVVSGGYLYMTGAFRGDVDFDPGPGTTMLHSGTFFVTDDIFIAKFDLNGNLIWAKNFGSSGTDWGKGIGADAAGNIYTTGYFRNTVDFDPGNGVFNLTATGNGTAFVLKLDPNGDFVWAKSMAGLSQGNSIDVSPDGMVYTTGDFSGTVDFDPGASTYNLTSAGSDDIFVSKLDVNGNFVWAKSMGGVGSDWGYLIKADSAGNVYTTGSFSATADFNPDQANAYNLTSAGDDDIFISKIDASGNFVWAKRIGGINSDEGVGLVVDPKGNVYSTGYFEDTADFDPGSGTFTMTANGTLNTYILKLDTDGNFGWAKSFVHTTSENGSSEGTTITMDNEGNLYCLGLFDGAIDFDPNAGEKPLTSLGSKDVYITKLDSIGSLIWAKSFGGTGNENAESIVLDGAGNFYVTGNYEGTCVFNSSANDTLTSHGDFDIYLVKYGTATGVDEPMELHQMSAYPNPTNGMIHIDMSKEALRNAEVVVTDALGKEISRTFYENLSACIVNVDGAKGMYVVRITAGRTSYVMRILKQ